MAFFRVLHCLWRDLYNLVAIPRLFDIYSCGYFVGADEDSTTANLEKLETAFNAEVEKVVTKRLGKSHKPDAGDDSQELTPEEMASMSIEDINAYYNKLLKK